MQRSSASLSSQRRGSKVKIPEVVDIDEYTEADHEHSRRRTRSMEIKYRKVAVDSVRHTDQVREFRLSSAFRNMVATVKRKLGREKDLCLRRKIPVSSSPASSSEPLLFKNIYKPLPSRFDLLQKLKKKTVPAEVSEGTSPRPPSSTFKLSFDGAAEHFAPGAPSTPTKFGSNGATSNPPVAMQSPCASRAGPSPTVQRKSGSYKPPLNPAQRVQRRKEMYKSRSGPMRNTDDRIRDFFEQNKAIRHKNFWQNRGIISGNFGNKLYITDEIVRDLDRDWHQDTPEFTDINPMTAAGKARWMHIEGAEYHRPYKSETIGKASVMVEGAFVEKNISCDLHHYAAQDFISDILLDEDEQPIGAMQYAFMKKYLWLDTLAVDQKFRGKGIGKLLMQRIFQVAKARKKDILLFALDDVTDFYTKFGFKAEPRFPRKPHFIGHFMVYPVESIP